MHSGLSQHFRQLLHGTKGFQKVFQIGTVRYNWPMSALASQAFSIEHCTDSADLPGFPLTSYNYVRHFRLFGVSAWFTTGTRVVHGRCRRL